MVEATRRTYPISEEIAKEIVRKSLHILIAFVPPIASILGVGPTIVLLGAGTLLYTFAEANRQIGKEFLLISKITVIASRSRDRHRFVLGPVTLGTGAMLALLLYPNQAATLAIYALAFGDGFASLVGKMAGSIKLPGTNGKTLEGSTACFVAVFVSALMFVQSPIQAVYIALFATFLEALPTKDMDNIIIPLATGWLTNILVG